MHMVTVVGYLEAREVRSFPPDCSRSLKKIAREKEALAQLRPQQPVRI